MRLQTHRRVEQPRSRSAGRARQGCWRRCRRSPTRVGVSPRPPSDAPAATRSRRRRPRSSSRPRAASCAALELRLKPEHPDIGRAKRVIAELEAKAEAEALQQPLSAVDAGAASPTTVGRPPGAARAEQMRTEMQRDPRSASSRSKREAARLQEAIADLTRPGAGRRRRSQSQLTELMRDYATLQEGYTALLRKSEDSKIAVNLERRQIGEQFKIIDGARLPEKPISPDRFRINMFGILGGLALGLGLVAFLEYRDTSFKSDDDVDDDAGAAGAGGHSGDDQRRRAPAARGGASCCSRPRRPSTCMLLAAAVMVVWQYRLLDRWSRLGPLMYESFYGFRERPFDLTPNPRFLVMTDVHREALSNLEYGDRQPQGHHAADRRSRHRQDDAHPHGARAAAGARALRAPAEPGADARRVRRDAGVRASS